jgi:hypothetical protein
VYRAAVRTDPVKTVDILKKEWFSTPAIDGKTVCLQALGHAGDADVIRNVLLPFLYSISPPTPAADSIPPGDTHMLAQSLAGNRVARPMLWKYIQENWAQVVAKLGGNPIVLARMITVSLKKFSDLDTLAEIEAFFARDEVDIKAFDRSLETVKDAIRARAAYKARDSQGIADWLREQGYSD